MDLSDCFLTGRRRENGFENETSRISTYSTSHNNSQNYGNQNNGIQNNGNQNNGNTVTPSIDDGRDERLDVKERERLENEISRLMERGNFK